ncbi:hypothetical protein Nepgr_001566 [Nepenthes gracilis]|uniref:Uncharacterized protein n=1 Tax=Nepenthes gracilis TaxID=150966 RepID=A0AAD3P5E1_NEPGR|nr:hypothetical protein Nepgr_001566 [Nepenthes gracilis]
MKFQQSKINKTPYKKIKHVSDSAVEITFTNLFNLCGSRHSPLFRTQVNHLISRIPICSSSVFNVLFVISSFLLTDGLDSAR